MLADKKYGLIKTSLINYPSEVASVIFTMGCNLRCPYCHNPELIKGSPPDNFLTQEEVFHFIRKRKNILGGVCITGGEPLLDQNIENIINFIHDEGLKVKIDTNGTIPSKLKKLNVDFIAMDIKTSPIKYNGLLSKNIKNIENKILESIDYIKQSGIPYHFRTTAVPGITDKNVIITILELIGKKSSFLISGFRPDVTLDPNYTKIEPFSENILISYKKLAKKYGIDCKLLVNH